MLRQSTRTAKYHDAKGKFAKMEVCKGAGKVTPAAAPASSAAASYKLDAKGKCRDAKGKMAEKILCKV
jgi:hypothetical protein